MKKTVAYILASFILGLSNLSAGNAFSLKSPDGKTRLEIGLVQNRLQYRVLFAGKEALDWSDLGLVTTAGSIGESTTLRPGAAVRIDERIPWSLGEKDTLVNQCNEQTFDGCSGMLSFQLQTRVYNGAVAFRYRIKDWGEQKEIRIRKESTAFCFPAPTVVYQYNHESVFTPTALDTLRKTCDFPVTCRNKSFYYSIGEAENETYTKAELKKGAGKQELCVVFPRDSVVWVDGLFQSPWRTVVVSKTAIGLHAHSDLYLKLNQTAVAEVPSWIKPGKLIRAQLTTKSGIDCIDFAVKHNMQYIMFDAGWYGAEFRSVSDPTQVTAPIDMPAVIQYGKEKGIGVILYVNYVGLRAKLDSLLPLYKSWGVSGFKFGFVDGLTQEGLSWLSEAIRKVNDAGFLLNIHDNYKPTGLSGKYPALLTQEGIRGDENSPDAFHTTVLPFTRFLAGPADFTFCYPNHKDKFAKNLKVSMAHQLALSVVYFSPLQALYWYGKPLDYTNDGETEFFDRVPTVWNDSRYLAGEIGENIAVARRNGKQWFMGAVAGPVDWKKDIKLDFLEKGVNYEATVYEDDGSNSIRKNVIMVRYGDEFPVQLAAKSGVAVVFSPAVQ